MLYVVARLPVRLFRSVSCGCTVVSRDPSSNSLHTRPRERESKQSPERNKTGPNHVHVCVYLMDWSSSLVENVFLLSTDDVCSPKTTRFSFSARSVFPSGTLSSSLDRWVSRTARRGSPALTCRSGTGTATSGCPRHFRQVWWLPMLLLMLFLVAARGGVSWLVVCCSLSLSFPVGCRRWVGVASGASPTRQAFECGRLRQGRHSSVGQFFTLTSMVCPEISCTEVFVVCFVFSSII